MAPHYFFTSITRISNLQDRPFTVEKLPRIQWQTGDYVVGEAITCPGCLHRIEQPNGRMVEVVDGELVVGAFGERAATLEAVGSWQAIADDRRFELMTAGGLFGKVTSKSFYLPPLMALAYRGHVMQDGQKVRMAQFVSERPVIPFDLPIILIIGTSMSAGKTTAARIIVRQLKQAGYRVIGAKLTGAARYRDILSIADAGADYIFDFVDVGLPSSICDPDHYRKQLRILLSKMARLEADVLVAEAGASPLEPYNGSVAIEEIAQQVRCTILCASDPYAVLGVASAFKCKPNIIAGAASNTSAAIDLVRQLTGSEVLNLLDQKSLPRLNEILFTCLSQQHDFIIPKNA